MLLIFFFFFLTFAAGITYNHPQLKHIMKTQLVSLTGLEDEAVHSELKSKQCLKRIAGQIYMCVCKRTRPGGLTACETERCDNGERDTQRPFSNNAAYSAVCS